MPFPCCPPVKDISNLIPCKPIRNNAIWQNHRIPASPACFMPNTCQYTLSHHSGSPQDRGRILIMDALSPSEGAFPPDLSATVPSTGYGGAVRTDLNIQIRPNSTSITSRRNRGTQIRRKCTLARREGVHNQYPAPVLRRTTVVREGVLAGIGHKACR